LADAALGEAGFVAVRHEALLPGYFLATARKAD
jgi:hypothetical protein